MSLYYFLVFVFYLPHITQLQLQKDTKKCRKKWQGGLKETIKLMLIILLGLLNYNIIFQRQHKNYGDGYKILLDGNYNNNQSVKDVHNC